MLYVYIYVDIYVICIYICRYVGIYTYRGSLSPVDLVPQILVHGRNVLSSGPQRPSKPTQAFILLTTNVVLPAWALHASGPQRPLKPTQAFFWP